MSYQRDPELEERLKELHQRVGDLNALKLFHHVFSSVEEMRDETGIRDARSLRYYDLNLILTDLKDQIDHRARSRELRFDYTVNEYWLRSMGSCRMGLKAVLKAVHTYGVTIPDNGELRGRFIPERY